MKTITLTLPTLFLSAAPLLAETNYMSGAIAYDRWSQGGGSLTEISGTFGYEDSIGRLTYGLDLDVSRISSDGNSLTMTDGTIALGYDVSPSFTVLGSFARTHFSSGLSEVANTYVLGGEYRLNDYTFGLSALRFSSGVDNTDFAQGFAEYSKGEYMAYASIAHGFDVDYTVYQLGIERKTEQYEAALDFMHQDIIDNVRLSGKYYIRPNMRLLADVNWLSFGPENITQFGLGAGYMVAQNTWFDVGVGRLNIADDNINQISLSLTFETGKRKLRTTERSFDPFDIYGDLPLIFGLGT